MMPQDWSRPRPDQSPTRLRAVLLEGGKHITMMVIHSGVFTVSYRGQQLQELVALFENCNDRLCLICAVHAAAV